MQCVVAENIHNPLRRATEIARGGGDVEKEAITEGVGGCLQRSFSRGLSKIGELSLNNSFSVELFYCHRCFKASIIVCIDRLFSRVG